MNSFLKTSMYKKLTLLLIPFFMFAGAYAQIGIFKNKENPTDTQLHVYLDTVNIEARSLRNYNFNRYEFIV
ncbi:MAG: hypothetical protein ACK4IY_09440, partial [Chitinophagales bacterium]